MAANKYSINLNGISKSVSTEIYVTSVIHKTPENVSNNNQSKSHSSAIQPYFSTTLSRASPNPNLHTNECVPILLTKKHNNIKKPKFPIYT